MDVMRASDRVNVNRRKRRYFGLCRRSIEIMLKVRKTLTFPGGEATDRELPAHSIISRGIGGAINYRRQRKRTTERQSEYAEESRTVG